MKGWLAGEYRAVLAQADNQLRAYALFRAEDDHIYLRQLYAENSVRRQGSMNCCPASKRDLASRFGGQG